MCLLANMGDPITPGDMAAEPSGILSGIHIEREELRIDMRQLVHHQPVEVEATYFVRNDGMRRQLDLHLIPGSPLYAQQDRTDGSFSPACSVWLDGNLIASPYIDTIDVPSQWLPPRYTPAVDGGESIPYWVHTGGIASGTYAVPTGSVLPVIAFRVELPSGHHALHLRYLIVASENHEAASVINWQAAFTLSPARRWGSVGRFNAHIILPTKWLAATEPLMHRYNDTLMASWPGVPSDALAITLRMPISPWIPFLSYGIAIIITISTIVVAGVCSRIIGGRLQADQRWLVVPVAFALGAGVALAGIAGFYIGDQWFAALLGNQYAGGYGSGASLGFLLVLAPVACVVTFVLTVDAGWKTFDQRMSASTMATI